GGRNRRSEARPGPTAMHPFPRAWSGHGGCAMPCRARCNCRGFMERVRMGKAIGIDLGTTNSCAAIVIDGVPTVITYPDGAKTIASVFAIDKSGKKLVGEEAREQAAANPLNTVAASKRL